jgi:rubrerythrin
MFEELKKVFQKEEEKQEEIKKEENTQQTSITITVQAYKCLRCGHTWIPRKKERPRVCPKCHSPYWDKPK